jgi:DNA helicase II / ATP-dependent DNA helicase PcrA
VMREHGIRIAPEELKIRRGAVSLSTVHSAKGQEWDYVFLLHCLDGKWGNAKKRELIPMPAGLLKHTDLSKKERNEDERRLFYVALTRARQRLYATYPKLVVSEGREKEVISSMFLEEIKDQLSPVTEQQVEGVLEQGAQLLAQLMTPTTSRYGGVSQRDFLSQLVHSFRLSASALNSYLRDQDEFVEANLLQVPRTKAAHLSFGSAMHVALERWHKFVLEQGSKPALTQIQASFETALQRELLSEADYGRRLKYGKEVLAQYYQEYGADTTDAVFIERAFGSGMSKTIMDGISLTGRIDRVDWIDKKEKTVRVIDYKTGRSRTLNDLLGTTKTAQADYSSRELALPESIRSPYKRQLLFYKLLAELDPTFQPRVSEGVFDFIEPDKQTGKLVRRHLDLPDQEVADLKELIKEVMAEIRELKFLRD